MARLAELNLEEQVPGFVELAFVSELHARIEGRTDGGVSGLELLSIVVGDFGIDKVGRREPIRGVGFGYCFFVSET